MVPLLERKLSLSILNISILLKTNYNKQRAINGYKAVIPYGLLEERGTDVCTDNNISIFYIITYHKKPVISSHSVTPRVPIFSAYHFWRHLWSLFKTDVGQHGIYLLFNKQDKNYCFVLLKQTPCFSDPCMSNSTCEVNYRENDYHCSTCPPFYIFKIAIKVSPSPPFPSPFFSFRLVFLFFLCFFLLLLS